MYRFAILLLALAASGYGASLPSRVVGGTDAAEGAYPYQASLRTFDGHFCGGVIIGQRWVITAAHCVNGIRFYPSLIQIVVGSLTLSRGGTLYRASRVIVHPNWERNLVHNDIALLEVRSNIVFTDNVQAVPLPTEDFTKADYPAVLTGWGFNAYPNGVLTNNLQELHLKIIDQAQCLASSSRIIDSQICTLTVAGEGACNGNSGSPLVADGALVGIVSWGTPCAVGEPDVYTRIWSFIDWIKGQTGL